MSTLVPQSPLMQPIQYQGQTYFSSQYFHAEYVQNSPHGGKFRRHHHFLRAIRDIPAYQKYLETGDIVEITWKSSNGVVNPNEVYFKPLFQAAGFRPLTLLNATAQVALSHHLDDEVSQQISVAANTSVARQATRKAGTLTAEECADRAMIAHMNVARLLGVPLHIAQQEAVKMTEAAYGVSYRALLNAAPAQDAIAAADEMLEPTELAARFGLGSGKTMNLALEKMGWQVRCEGGTWQPTPSGTPFASTHSWASRHGTKTGYNLKWRRSAVREAFLMCGLIPHAKESQ